MRKVEELVQHLANLTFVMEFHERLGTQKNPLITQEFARSHESLIEEIEKEEKERESRKSEQQHSRAQNGAEVQGSEPVRNGPDRPYPEP